MDAPPSTMVTKLLSVSTVVLTLQATSAYVQPTATEDGQWLPGRSRCRWDQYYDDNVENCGPCREICDAMTVTRTEEQCRGQCADYLVSKTCRTDQYFDEMVKSCAPCSELCNQRDAKGTSPRECVRKCPKYTSANAQDNSLTKRANHPTPPAPPSSSSTSSSGQLPGIIASVCLGVIAVGAISGLVVRRQYLKQQAARTEPPRNNDPAGNGHNVDEVHVPMVPLEPGTPVQVSSEDVGAGDIALQRYDTPPLQYGHAECDPVAPSSAAYLHVLQQQFR